MYDSRHFICRLLLISPISKVFLFCKLFLSPLFVNKFLKFTVPDNLIFLMLAFLKHFRSSSHFASEMSLRLTECRIKLVIVTASLSVDLRVRCLKWRLNVVSLMCILLGPQFGFHGITWGDHYHSVTLSVANISL